MSEGITAAERGNASKGQNPKSGVGTSSRHGRKPGAAAKRVGELEQGVSRREGHNPEDGTAHGEANCAAERGLLRKMSEGGREPRWTCTSRNAEGAPNLMGGTTQAAAPVASTATCLPEFAPRGTKYPTELASWGNGGDGRRETQRGRQSRVEL